MIDIISITEEWRVVKTRAVVTGVAQQDNLDLTVSTIAIRVRLLFYCVRQEGVGEREIPEKDGDSFPSP